MHKVVISPQGLEALLSAGSSLTELEFELYGEDTVPFGCKAGACGACVIKVEEGVANLGVKGDEERRFLEALGYPGIEFRLACQCRLNGDVKIRAMSL
ncbi:2Fe-2S iron-sulfur cluster-binding protein [Burkholderia multivorans]|uniref:2Fe-2S iron-sulfur cluster-binding protein n=1 Tax=Burkholderia multivorans TaxID=87883 RepID=UPI000F4F47C6|nr:2Fe-2S iron-sulfur cluster-binding protein [Burkholderia multivorans]AYY57735.1 (2Fe-2S)-binding protein [Burkholderia multivorans]MCA8436631.1 (2Fe-2S)-binding protein [Burkholderia multivorans]